MTALLFYKSRDAQGAFGRHHDIKNRATTYCAAALNREILPNALPYTAHSKANQVFFYFVENINRPDAASCVLCLPFGYF